MRIALVSPYSWTYPGGVTRHIEALAAELAAKGHEPRILAPFDPARRAVRAPAQGRPAAGPSGARGLRLARAHGRDPGQRRGLEPRGRRPTRSRPAPRAARGRLRRRPHPRAGRAGGLLGRPVLGRRAAARRHLPHLLGEPAHERDRRGGARRAPAHEPAPRADRGLRSGGLDRPPLLRRQLPHHPQRRAPPARSRALRGGRTGRAADPLHRPGRPAQGPAGSARRLRGAARARAGGADARRRERRGGRAHDAGRFRDHRAGEGLGGRRSRSGCARPTCSARRR